MNEEELSLIRLAKAGDEQAKETLLRNNDRLMKSIVRRYLGKGTDYDDLYSLAGIGLLKAVYGFEERFGVRFSTYAVPMIAGEIKRFLRDDGSIKVSRTIKQRAREINRYIAEQTALGNVPTISELAEIFHEEESEIVFLLDSARMPLSLSATDERGDDEQAPLLERLGKDYQEDWIESIELRDAIVSLSDRERRIILLRYFRDMTQSEVARQIGVSQVQISRIENKILEQFRRKLG
ncbi:MAG: sigma-70 family RNA polymerase sigma factor [Christensenellaceae bacterium]